MTSLPQSEAVEIFYIFILTESAKYNSLLEYENLEDSIFDIRSALCDLATVLRTNPGDFTEFSKNIQNRELLLENRFLKEKVAGLENQLHEKSLRIKMLEKLVLETHL